MERFEDALSAIEKAVNNENADISGVVLEHYGDILYMNGKIDEALVQWNKAKEYGDATEDINRKVLTGRINE